MRERLWKNATSPSDPRPRLSQYGVINSEAKGQLYSLEAPESKLARKPSNSGEVEELTGAGDKTCASTKCLAKGRRRTLCSKPELVGGFNVPASLKAVPPAL